MQTHAEHRERADYIRAFKRDELLYHREVVAASIPPINLNTWRNLLAAWPVARAIRKSSCWAPHQGPRECARRVRQMHLGKGGRR